MKKKNRLIERAGSISSCVSGTMSFLGSYQVCHNLCLGIITLLAIIGVTAVGMPLLFLTKVALPFWIAAALLFGLTLLFYFKMRCISKNLLLFNAGVLIAGVPFKAVQGYSPVFWGVGGALISVSVVWFIKDKLKYKRRGRKHHA